MENINHSSEPFIFPLKKIPGPHNKRIIKVPDEVFLDKQTKLNQLIKANPKTLTKFNFAGFPKAPQEHPGFDNHESWLNSKRMRGLIKTAHLLRQNKTISNLTYKVDPYAYNLSEMSLVISSLKNHHQATSLHLKIDARGTCTPQHLRSLSIILGCFKRLTSLTIDFTTNRETTPQHIASVFFALSRLRSSTSLSLSFLNFGRLGDPNLRALPFYLGRFPQLKSLSVNPRDHNPINPAAISFLAPALKKLVSLQTLDVSLGSYPHIQNQAIIEFFSSIKDIKTLTSLLINLKEYSLEDITHSEPISTGLNLLSCHLKTLNFKGYSNLDDNGLCAISNVLQQKFPSLENLSLNFSDNRSISAQGLSHLASALQSLHSLSSLQLDLSRRGHYNRFPTLSQIVGSGLKSLTNLKALDLDWEGQIQDPGQLSYLADSLKGLIALNRLCLRVELQGTRGQDFEIFTNSLRNLTGLSSLILDSNIMGRLLNESFVNLSSALKNLVQLRHLSVRIGRALYPDKQIPESLATALQSLPLLDSVTLNLRCYTTPVEQEDSCVPIFKALGQLKYLKKLVLSLPGSRGHILAEETHLKHVEDKSITWIAQRHQGIGTTHFEAPQGFWQ